MTSDAAEIHRFPVVVGEGDIDELGHANNARYLDYLEKGRMDWYAQAGLFARLDAATGGGRVGTVVVNVDIDYLRECRRGEQLVVTTAPARLGRKSFAVAQRLLKADGTVAAEAIVTSVVMDLDSREALVLPASLGELFPRTAG